MLVLNREGSNVPKRNVTPAECVFLEASFKGVVGANPVTQLTIVDGATAVVVMERDATTRAVTRKRERTPADEKRRLMNLYGQAKGSNDLIDKLFPGAKPAMAETFEEAGFTENLQFQAPDKSKQGQEQSAPMNRSDDDFMFVTAGEDFDPSTLKDK